MPCNDATTIDLMGLGMAIPQAINGTTRTAPHYAGITNDNHTRQAMCRSMVLPMLLPILEGVARVGCLQSLGINNRLFNSIVEA
jgi:hypothetical protein